MEEKTTYGIVELHLQTNKYQVKQLNDIMYSYYEYYKYVLGKAKSQLKYMKRNRKRQQLLRQLKRWHIAKYTPTKEQKKHNTAQLKEITKSYHIESGFSFRTWVYNINKDKHKHLSSDIRGLIIDQVWKGLDNVIYGKGKKLGFTKFSAFTIVTKNYNTPFKIIDGHIISRAHNFNIKLAPFDDYRKEIMSNRELRYIRIVPKVKKNHTDYALQVTYKGAVPLNNRKLGTNKSLGIDIGPSSYAYVTDTEARLGALFGDADKYNKRIDTIQKKMSRLDELANPDAFEITPKGHKYIKGHKLRHTQHWYSLRKELQYVYRLKSQQRKFEFETLANHLIALSPNIKMEKLSVQGWASGLFGKSVGNNAPAMLMEIIKRKLAYHDVEPVIINTQKAKLSQLHHDTGVVEKAQLNERSKYIAGEHVQRDLYSAWLASHVTEDLYTVDPHVADYFESYMVLQSEAIDYLMNNMNVQLDSFGLRSDNFTTKSKLSNRYLEKVATTA